MKSQLRPAGGPKKVLVVEDELFVAMDIERVLLENGYAVLGPASTITAALRLLDFEVPDVALLDFNVLGEPVTPVADRLRIIGIPIVLTSAYDFGRMSEIEGLKGALYVQKPFDDDALLKALDDSIP